MPAGARFESAAGHVNTNQLIRSLRTGAEILHNGAPVQYRPRHPHDRKPWRWTDGRTEHRYTAAQCQAYVTTKEDQ